MIKQLGKKLFFKKDRPDRYPDHSMALRLYNRSLSFGAGIVQQMMNIIQYGPFRLAMDPPRKSNNLRRIIIVAIVKNEGKYIEEWLIYHHLRGFDGFILYDNGSTDKTASIIRRYENEYNIKYIYFPGKSRQIAAYTDASERLKNSDVWMLTIDVDEFFVPVGINDIHTWLNTLSSRDTQVLVGWMMFGSSGQKKETDGLVLERFKHHALDTHIASYKPLVKPEYVVSSKMSHMFNVVGRTVDTNEKRQWYYPYPALIGSRPSPKNKVRINHYYTKSLAEYEAKSAKGDVFDASVNRKSMKEFCVQDRNEAEDDLIDDLIPLIKQKMGISK